MHGLLDLISCDTQSAIEQVSFLFIDSEILVNIVTYIESVYIITWKNIYVTRIRRRHAYNCLLRKTLAFGIRFLTEVIKVFKSSQ